MGLLAFLYGHGHTPWQEDLLVAALVAIALVYAIRDQLRRDRAGRRSKREARVPGSRKGDRK